MSKQNSIRLTILVVLVILTGLIAWQSFFSVDETNFAIVTRLGETQRIITEPGTYTKAPLRDKVVYIKPVWVFEITDEHLLTKDPKRITVAISARGEIVDPMIFARFSYDVSRRKLMVNDIVASELRTAVADYLEIDIVSGNRQVIADSITEDVNRLTRKEYGIEISDVVITDARPTTN